MRIRTIAGASILAPRFSQSGPVVHCSHAFLMRAVSTTIKIAAGFHTMADYFARTCSHSERVREWRIRNNQVARDAIVKDFQRLIVFISTNFTLHKLSAVIFSGSYAMSLLGEPSLVNTILFHTTTYAPLTFEAMRVAR